MVRNIISTCLSLTFLVFLAVPTIDMMDDSIDISYFFMTSEEEEKCSKKDKNTELLFLKFGVDSLDFTINEAENDSEYYCKHYPKPHLNLISPPPELYMLIVIV